MKSDTRAKQSAETADKLIKSRGSAFDAYVAKLAQIQEELSELQARSDDHFGNDPDSIHWSHVGDLANILASLQLANGAGTTAIAAQQLGRDFIGLELNPDYRDIAISRIANGKAE